MTTLISTGTFCPACGAQQPADRIPATDSEVSVCVVCDQVWRGLVEGASKRWSPMWLGNGECGNCPTWTFPHANKDNPALTRPLELVDVLSREITFRLSSMQHALLLSAASHHLAGHEQGIAEDQIVPAFAVAAMRTLVIQTMPGISQVEFDALWRSKELAVVAKHSATEPAVTDSAPAVDVPDNVIQLARR